MSRLALIVAVTALAWALGATSAFGCITQNPGASGEGAEPSAPVHPGGPMSYSVSGLDEGARYQVFVGGRPVTSELTKEDGPGSVRGTFTLGDYGSAPRQLRVWVYIDHEAAGTGHDEPFTGNRDGLSLNYLPPVAPEGQGDPTPAPSGSAPTPPAAATTSPDPARVGGEAAADTRSAPVVSRSLVRAGGNRATGRARVPVVERAQRPARVGHASPVEVSAAPVSSTAATRAAEGVPEVKPATRRPAARPSLRRTAHAPATFAPAARGDDEAMSRDAARPSTRSAPVRAGLPTALLLGLIVALAGGGLGWAAWRRRRPCVEPPPGVSDTLAIEAELQEMIAERRAAEAASEPPTRVPV